MISKSITLLYLTAIPFCVFGACKERTFCKTQEGLYGVCMNGECTILQARSRTSLQFKVTVKYPEAMLQAHNGKDLYIRGNAFGFKWDRGVKLNQLDTDTWQAKIHYESSEGGFQCQFCTDKTKFNGDLFEYRIYVDDRTNMVGGNFRLKIPISKTSSFFDQPREFLAYPWFFTKESSKSIISIEAPQIGSINRSILIHKPPSFNENTYKRYPTLLVFDLDEKIYNISSHLINEPVVKKESVAECVIIGFGDYKSTSERRDLLTQVKGPTSVCINGTLENSCDGCIPEGLNYTEFRWYIEHKCGKVALVGGKGNDTLDFLVDTVIPRVNELTNGRILTDQPNLGIMGYSFGGLLSCHAAWTRPSVFGFAACQSPSFWWPAVNTTLSAFFFNNISLKDHDLRTYRPFQRIYLDAGDTETGDPFTLMQAMVAAAEDMSTTTAFEWDRNLWVYIYPGEPHWLAYWVMRMWNPMRIFFPANPRPTIVDGGACIHVSGKGNTDGSAVTIVNNLTVFTCFHYGYIKHDLN